MSRTRTDVLIDGIEAYLKEFFSARAAQEHIEDIAIWQRGYSGVLSGAFTYPAVIIIVSRKQMQDLHEWSYQCQLMIAIANDDAEQCDHLGHIWEDILQDAFQDDWSLGGTCFDTNDLTIESDFAVSGVYGITADFTVTVMEATEDVYEAPRPSEAGISTWGGRPVRIGETIGGDL